MALIADVDYRGAHRLIPWRAGNDSVLETLGLSPEGLADLSEVDAATNERLLAEQGRNFAIGPGELLYGVPHARIINAAFTHAGTHGNRFSSAARGVWYAAVELQTSLAEVQYHKHRFLKETRAAGRYSFEYADYQADFAAPFHSLDAEERSTCLVPEPVPACYRAPQALASFLLHSGSNGIVYPSVRNPGGTCIACFRPALVTHPTKGESHRITVELT